MLRAIMLIDICNVSICKIKKKNCTYVNRNCWKVTIFPFLFHNKVNERIRIFL